MKVDVSLQEVRKQEQEGISFNQEGKRRQIAIDTLSISYPDTGIQNVLGFLLGCPVSFGPLFA